MMLCNGTGCDADNLFQLSLWSCHFMFGKARLQCDKKDNSTNIPCNTNSVKRKSKSPILSYETIIMTAYTKEN